MTIKDINAGAIRADESAPAIHPQFRSRWSARAMNGDPVPVATIETLLEAARWAPSCFNAQPWRFAYVTNTDDEWSDAFATVMEGNQRWVAKAGALIAVASRRTYEETHAPSPTHTLDTGAAWMSIALQAFDMGLVAHAMLGFHPQLARSNWRVPLGFDLHTIVAVGYPGEIDDLHERLRDRETPSARKPLAAIAQQGGFDSFEA